MPFSTVVLGGGTKQPRPRLWRRAGRRPEPRTRSTMTPLVRSSRRVLTVCCAASSLVVLAACNSNEDTPTGAGGSSSRLVFASSRDNPATFELDLYTVNADGSDLRRMTQSPGDDGEPTWSTKRRIAFTSLRDGNNETYSMNADGSDVQRLTNNTANDQQPSWSPDGAHIAFASNRDGNFEIYVMNADGTNQVRLTTEPSSVENGPRWSPDGSRIAFQLRPRWQLRDLHDEREWHSADATDEQPWRRSVLGLGSRRDSGSPSIRSATATSRSTR